MPAAPSRSSGGLTTRAAVLGLVLCALLLSAALPLREYLSQRAEISRLDQAQNERRARVAALQERRKMLDDPDYLRTLARERLHFVLPGETAYILIDPDAPAPPVQDRAAATRSRSPWYSQLWHSVQEADRPQGQR